MCPTKIMTVSPRQANPVFSMNAVGTPDGQRQLGTAADLKGTEAWVVAYGALLQLYTIFTTHLGLVSFATTHRLALVLTTEICRYGCNL